MLAFSLIEYIIDSSTAKVWVEGPSNQLQLPPFLHDALPDEKRRSFENSATTRTV